MTLPSICSIIASIPWSPVLQSRYGSILPITRLSDFSLSKAFATNFSSGRDEETVNNELQYRKPVHG